MQENGKWVSSGIEALDELIHGFRLGDNVVWQVESLDDYRRFSSAFSRQALADNRRMIYIRFGSHPPILKNLPGLTTESFDPRAGFDLFSGKIHHIITQWGREAFYVFDNLSCLVEWWATDELLANFFQATCPYLYELDTVAFFALERARHANDAVARIRDTTQVLLDSFRLDDALHVRPLKVWQRHSPHMFWPHRVEEDACIPVPPESAPPTELAYETSAPWDTVYAELKSLPSLPASPDADFDESVVALRRELTRMLLGENERIMRLADRYLPPQTLMRIRERVVGSGRIGGKAAGMLLARAIVRTECPDAADAFPFLDEDAFYIGSDVFYTFLVRNDLFRARLAATRTGILSHDDFDTLEAQFLAGRFDEARQEEFRALLDLIGEHPIIVRSSSLLEDGFGNAFAGKYRSEFCVNRGSLDERLEVFQRAVKWVYASTLNPDALRYRRNRGLLESDEQMAILVQRVAGTAHGKYFFPTLAGVAFSRNLYAWTDRIDPRAGVVRLVFGLGTRAVNRVGRDYPRLIAVSHPELRPEIGNEVAIYSQRDVDVLDQHDIAFRTVPLEDVLTAERHPRLHLLASIRHNGYLTDPVGRRLNPSADIALTFNRLIKETDWVRHMRRMLAALEKSYDQPVDTEFAAEVGSRGEVRINILQCRPMWLPGATGRVAWPEGLRADQVLFRSDRFINGGVLPPMRYIVYVDPGAYGRIREDKVRKTLPRIIGQINQDPRMAEGRLMLLGPGRWGSSNPDLGIGVGYADIDHVSVLVEVAQEADGRVPEVSYGTHFFQDLVEADIFYVPVFPGREESAFNREFFERSGNRLTEFFPALGPYASLIRLIDVTALEPGRAAHLVADPEGRRAVCYY